MAKVRGSFTDFVDFSRASEATYLGSDGLLKTATNNEPRVEYDANGNVKGLLIEEARTNLVTYSDASTNSFYPHGSTRTSVTLGNGVSATQVTLANDSFNDWTLRVPVSAETTYTFSFFGVSSGIGVKPGVFDASNGAWIVTPGTVYNLTAEPTRVVITFTTPVACTSVDLKFHYGADPTETGDVVAIGGFQLEAGSFPTSYIPTSGATATRSADIADIATANFGYNQKAGTVVVEASQLQNISGDYNSIVNFGSSSSNRIDIGALNNNGYQSIRESGADSVQYDQNASQNINAHAGGEVSVVALSFNSRSANSSMNGTNGTEDTSVIVPTASVVKVGNDYSSRYLNGHIRSIKYLPRRLSNTQLQEFTS